MEIKKIIWTNFKKILNKGKFLEYELHPYFSNYDNGFVLILSSKINEPKIMTYNRNETAIVLPYQKLEIALNKYKEEIQTFINVKCPTISLYKFTGEKIMQFDFNKGE